MRDLLELQQHLGCLQGVATKLEEIVIDSHIGAPEQATPDLGDLNLERRVRQDGSTLDVGKERGELRPRDLAGDAERQAVDNVNLARHLKRRQQVIEKGDQLRRGGGGAGVEDDGGADILAQPWMRYGEGRGLAHGRMTQQRLLDVVGRDLLAAAIDDFLGAADDGEDTLLVDQAEIAGWQPAV